MNNRFLEGTVISEIDGIISLWSHLDSAVCFYDASDQKQSEKILNARKCCHNAILLWIEDIEENLNTHGRKFANLVKKIQATSGDRVNRFKQIRQNLIRTSEQLKLLPKDNRPEYIATLIFLSSAFVQKFDDYATNDAASINSLMSQKQEVLAHLFCLKEMEGC